MAAREHYSHAELLGKTSNEIQEMLFQKGINWNDYPDFFKRGTFVQREELVRAFSPDELAALPAKHEAHTNPELVTARSVISEIAMPPFDKVTNRVEVLFSGQAPTVESQTKP